MNTFRKMKKETANKAPQPQDPDKVIVRLAKAGKLMDVGKRAIAKTHELGYAATIIEQGNIVSLLPDGTKVIIGIAAKRSGKKYKSGKVTLR